MSGRGKYKSMGVSYREGQDGGGRGGGGGGRGRGRGNRYRKTLNGNYIKQGGEEGNEDSARPQVSGSGHNPSCCHRDPLALMQQQRCRDSLHA